MTDRGTRRRRNGDPSELEKKYESLLESNHRCQ